MLYFIVSLITVVLDQWLKITVVKHIELGSAVTLIPGLLGLTHAENSGISFGFLSNSPMALTVISALTIAVCFALVFAQLLAERLEFETIAERLSLSFMLGGAIGNLIDRIAFRQVTDMFQFEFVNFAIFNVADVFLTIGTAMLILTLLLRELKSRKSPVLAEAVIEAPTEEITIPTILIEPADAKLPEPSPEPPPPAVEPLPVDLPIQVDEPPTERTLDGGIVAAFGTITPERGTAELLSAKVSTSEPFGRLLLTVDAVNSGERLDVFLARFLGSRSSAERAADSLGFSKSYRVKPGEIFELTDFLAAAPEPYSAEPEDIALDIVYEDEDLIVVNKPKGLVVHPAPGHYGGTLVNALLYHCAGSLSGIGGELRPGIVHRIDKDTSGLLIAAKNDFAHRELAAQLADHSLSRTYEAVIRGSFPAASGTIDLPIGRANGSSSADRKRMAVRRDGKAAITHWELIEKFSGYSHIRCKLETGRTHQIRVHLAHSGHPVLGDTLYGAGSKLGRIELPFGGQCLHARELTFVHPRTKEQIHLECPLPEYFEWVLTQLTTNN